jgi:rubredoxin
MAETNDMYQCPVATCGYIYSPKRGDKKSKVPKNTCFDDLPDDWRCPLCGSRKVLFCQMKAPGSKD